MRTSKLLASFLSVAIGVGAIGSQVFAAQTISYEDAENAFKLDTLSYNMAPGNLYDFKVTLKGSLTQNDVQVSDSRTGSVVKLSRIAGTDKYRIQAVKEGTSYVVAQVGDAHLSFTVEVKKGVKQSGKASHSNYAVVSAPAPKPVENTGSIKTLYSGANYGAKNQSDYNYVVDIAKSARSSSAVKKANAKLTALSDADFETLFGIAKTDTWVDILLLSSRVSSGGKGSGSAGSAYDYFTGKQTMCGDIAKAKQAVLQANGYDAKLAWGTWNGVAHQWCMVKNPDDGQWYHLTGTIGTSPASGFVMNGSGYNR